MRFHKGDRVEVDAPGSLYDRYHGQVLDVDDNGIVEVAFHFPNVGPVGEATNLFAACELAPEGHGRPVTWRERLGRALRWFEG